MAADTDPPPLPRPSEAAAGSLAERARDLWARSGDGMRAFATPAIAFVAVAVAGVLVWSRIGAEPPPPLEMALPTIDAAAIAMPPTAAQASEATRVVVHVAGAVPRPGVYELSATARIGDAVDLAGGAGVDADLDRINLAATVADGVQINVPRIGQAIVVPLEPTTAGAATDTAALIDVNTADAVLLETLPGVGPVTAAAIVAHREKHGSFPSVASLDAVTGIGPARLEALRDLVTVGSGQ